MTDPRDGPDFDFSGMLDAVRRAWRAYRNPPCIVARRCRVAYFPVLKAGTSSIMGALARAEGIEPGAFEWARPTDVEAEFGASWHSFTVVRNPWTRLESCYRDKIVGRIDGYEGERRELYNGFKRYNEVLGITLFWLEMEFGEFVRRVCWIPDIAADPHIRSQFRRYTLPSGKVLAQRVLPLEDTGKIDRYLQRIGVLRDGESLPRERASVAAEPTLYDEHSSRAVGRRYARDARMLGYRPQHGEVALECRT